MPRVHLFTSLLVLFVAALATACYAEEDVPEFFWKTHIELSIVSTSGNTDTQSAAAKLEVKKEGPANRYFFNGSFLRTESQGTENSFRITLDGRFERPITKRTFGLFSGGYIKDRFSGYDLRVFAGPGLGRVLVSRERHSLQGILMLLYYHDEFSVGDRGTDDYVNLKVSARYWWKIRENLKFIEALDLSTSLEDRDRYFLDSVTSFEVKVAGSVSVGVSYTLNYQHRPASIDLRHTDTTFLTSLIIDL